MGEGRVGRVAGAICFSVQGFMWGFFVFFGKKIIIIIFVSLLGYYYLYYF